MRAEVDETKLAEGMGGEMPVPSVRSENVAAKEGLTVRDLVVKGDRKEDAVRGVAFEARRGEIFGIGGVDGNGQIELAEAIAGVRPTHSGAVEWAGGEAPRTGYVPQDRQIDGLALGLSVEENLLISGYKRERLSRGPFLRLGEIRRWARELIDRFEIRTPSPKERVASLSGGNQQKIVVSRTLDSEPELLVVVNPTRGLDIRATNYVHGKIREARDAGTAVVLFSTDLDELYALSDRRVFISRGQLIEDYGAASFVGGAR
jgi:simple sugar transport system ATP-binding protein